MPVKVFHPDHGFVLTNSQDEIDMLVAKGGKIVLKNKEVFPNENKEVKEATQTQILRRGRPRFNQD